MMYSPLDLMWRLICRIFDFVTFNTGLIIIKSISFIYKKFKPNKKKANDFEEYPANKTVLAFILGTVFWVIIGSIFRSYLSEN